jgi:hypothetical protein
VDAETQTRLKARTRPFFPSSHLQLHRLLSPSATSGLVESHSDVGYSRVEPCPTVIVFYQRRPYLGSVYHAPPALIPSHFLLLKCDLLVCSNRGKKYFFQKTTCARDHAPLGIRAPFIHVLAAEISNGNGWFSISRAPNHSKQLVDRKYE